MQQGMLPPANGAPEAEGVAPVSFFAPAGVAQQQQVALGPDGQPLRKRRRRRRRGRGGRQREWRAGMTGGDGAPPGEGGPINDSGGDGGGDSGGDSDGDAD